MTDAQVIYFMKEAQQEGQKALPACLPNPPVGCVIVKEGHIVARGHTSEPGGAHAEAMALKQLVNDTDGTLFVTLEPCSFHGRTPSCAQRIVTTNIRQVYVGIIDPDPRNNGLGVALMKSAGIAVHVGTLATSISNELKPYLFSS